MRDSKEPSGPDQAAEDEIFDPIDATLAPIERFRRSRKSVARRCAKRPPKTSSGQARKPAPQKQGRHRRTWRKLAERFGGKEGG